MGYEPKKNDGLIVWVTNPRKMMWKNDVENGLIMMGDLPKRKECEVRSHYNGWPTQVEDRKKYEVVSL